MSIKLEILDSPTWFRDIMSDSAASNDIEAFRRFWVALEGLDLAREFNQLKITDLIHVFVAAKEIQDYILDEVDESWIEAYKEAHRGGDAVDRAYEEYRNQL